MTTEPTTTMDKLNELREQFKRGTKQAADALADIMGVVDDVFDNLRKPIIVPPVEPKPIVFRTSAQVFIEVDPDHPNFVTKVRLLPAQFDIDVYDKNGWADEVVREMHEFVDTNNWAPLEKLPDDVVWEG